MGGPFVSTLGIFLGLEVWRFNEVVGLELYVIKEAYMVLRWLWNVIKAHVVFEKNIRLFCLLTF